MVAVPAVMPDTTPLELTLATVVLLLLQLPPVAPLSAIVIVEPTHTVVGPESTPA